MIEQEQYELRVLGWVAEWARGWRREPITLDTPINGPFWKGLGIDGDDAVNLLEHLRKASGVSFDNFEYEKYFDPEGDLF